LTAVDGPRISQLTKLSQEDKKRFELEWVLPLEPGLATHVTLCDLERFPPEAVAGGQGADEAEALLDLWTILSGQDTSPSTRGAHRGLVHVVQLRARASARMMCEGARTRYDDP
jgi:hypothetical protein